jgi:hypothetical protein
MLFRQYKNKFIHITIDWKMIILHRRFIGTNKNMYSCRYSTVHRLHTYVIHTYTHTLCNFLKTLIRIMKLIFGGNTFFLTINHANNVSRLGHDTYITGLPCFILKPRRSRTRFFYPSRDDHSTAKASIKNVWWADSSLIRKWKPVYVHTNLLLLCIK